MGLLRLVLALAVLVSHGGMRFFELNPGVSAVIGFYLISGYVMAGLIQRHYAQAARLHWFYLDRVLRLYPQYLAYAAITLTWFLAVGQHTDFLRRLPTAADLFNNLTLAPLNYYMYNGSDAFTLIPPAWSLGAEIQFYLLAPLLVLWPRLGAVALAASLGVHVLALHGVLHTDWYGYRLLPGVLWVFGLGMALFHWQRSRPRWADAVGWGAPLAALAVYAYLRARGLHAAPYHQEVLVGWGLGLPLLHWLSRRPEGAISRWAGNVSYGVFLNHFLLIWWLPAAPQRSPLEWAALAGSSIALSWLTFTALEKPVLRRRRLLRTPAAHP